MAVSAALREWSRRPLWGRFIAQQRLCDGASCVVERAADALHCAQGRCPAPAPPSRPLRTNSRPMCSRSLVRSAWSGETKRAGIAAAQSNARKLATARSGSWSHV